MRIFGYVSVLMSLYFLFVNELILGIILFSISLFMSCGLRFNATSAGAILMVLSSGYMFHNGFSLIAFIAFFTGFVIACLANGKALENYNHDDYWGSGDY